MTSDVFDSRVQFRWKAAKLGKHTLALRVVPISDERTEENNAAKADVQVMEDKIRVLVADNFPRWETRYLLNLFKRDDRVEFEQLLFEPQPAPVPGRARPVSRNARGMVEISRRDSRRRHCLATRRQSQQKLLREYITEAGGNLIIVAGKDAMPRRFSEWAAGRPSCPVEAGDRGSAGEQSVLSAPHR